MSEAAQIIVVAPDSFKGSCSSSEAARALAQGVSSVFGETAEIREMPMADGGEGTLETLVTAWGGHIDSVPTTDALGRPCVGRIGLGRNSNTSLSAVIEAADANGLPAVSDLPLRPLDADSAGVGTLILAALDAGAEAVLLCLGGSATNDGGAGMLRVLGVKLLDADGRAVESGARGLSQLHTIDMSGLDPRARNIDWRIACDVDNPLLGSRGAAAVFGPQKGANSEEVRLIDRGLERLLIALADATGTPADALRTSKGLGAAGGLALGLHCILNAQLMPGARLVSETIGLREALRSAAFVITGEGRLDSQSIDGKVVSRVLEDAGADTPVFVIAGSLDLTAIECREVGIAAALSIARGPAELIELQANSLQLLTEAAAQLSGVLTAIRRT